MADGYVDQHASLLWAGNHDGDGKIDLNMNVSDHYRPWDHALVVEGEAWPAR